MPSDVEQNHQFVAGSADVSGADRKYGVAGPGALQQKFDGFVHGTYVMDVLVASVADSGSQSLTRNTRYWRFTGSINIDEHQQVGPIEGDAEVIPEMLRTRVAMGLEKHQQAVEIAAASGFERGANFRWVMTIVVDDRDVVHTALYVKATPNAAKIGEALADEFSRYIQIKGDRGGRSGVAHVVNSRRMRQAKDTQVFAFIHEAEFAD